MNGLKAAIGINGFSNGFWSINHWSRWFFRLATIGLDGFAMVFGLATTGLDGFSMVANHWSNDEMVTIHRYGLLSLSILTQDIKLFYLLLCSFDIRISGLFDVIYNLPLVQQGFVPSCHWLLAASH